jgi:hypothetical protein
LPESFEGWEVDAVVRKGGSVSEDGRVVLY